MNNFRVTRVNDDKLQIKSKDRIRSLGEVYTADREVCAMLDMLGPIKNNPYATYLEPSCGNGNFLVEILRRKLDGTAKKAKSQKEFEFELLKRITSIYGIDICPENIKECRHRLLAYIKGFYSGQKNTLKASPSFWKSVESVLLTNIQIGDMLKVPTDIYFMKYIPTSKYVFTAERYLLSNMQVTATNYCSPAAIFNNINYLEFSNGFK